MKRNIAVRFLMGWLLITGFLLGSDNCLAIGEGEEMHLAGSITIKYFSEKPMSASIEDNPAVEEMSRMALSLFKSADDRFRLMVTPQIVNNIRKSKHVEIVLDEELPVLVPIFGSQEIRIQRLLIPLDGKFAWNEGERCVLFFGNPEIEEFNVVSNLKPEIEQSQFLNLLETIEKKQ